MREIHITLPNGARVSPKKLEELFPSMFRPACIHNIREAVEDDWQLWDIPPEKKDELMAWARDHAYSFGHEANYWLMICITGTAQNLGMNPIALFDVFEHVPKMALALFDQSTRPSNELALKVQTQYGASPF